jgi:hypothetical protein
VPHATCDMEDVRKCTLVLFPINVITYYCLCTSDDTLEFEIREGLCSAS